MRRVLRKVVVAHLAWLTRGILRRYHPTVVAVAGSVGKTLTREAIYTGLKDSFDTWEAHGSLNSEIGLPLAVFGIEETPPTVWEWVRAIRRGWRLRWLPSRYPDVLVLEFGEDHPGDIAYLTALVRPTVGVITAIAPAHLKEFKTIDAIADEMRALISALPPDGCAVLNGDDPAVAALARGANATVATVGFTAGTDVRAKDVTLLLPRRPIDSMQPVVPPRLTTEVLIGKTAATLELIGFVAPHQVLSALIAVAVGRSFGIDAHDLLLRLKALAPFKGRMRLLPGLRGSHVIDDSYNASPRAVTAALDVVAKFPSVKRRIVVLGVMNELGEQSRTFHIEAGTEAAKVADVLVLVETPGVDNQTPAQEYATGARAAKMDDDAIVPVPDAVAAGRWLKRHVRPGDVVLVKGSQVARLEQAVAAILADPSIAPTVLVRQSAFWQRR